MTLIVYLSWKPIVVYALCRFSDIRGKTESNDVWKFIVTTMIRLQHFISKHMKYLHITWKITPVSGMLPVDLWKWKQVNFAISILLSFWSLIYCHWFSNIHGANFPLMSYILGFFSLVEKYRDEIREVTWSTQSPCNYMVFPHNSQCSDTGYQHKGKQEQKACQRILAVRGA